MSRLAVITFDEPEFAPSYVGTVNEGKAIFAWLFFTGRCDFQMLLKGKGIYAAYSRKVGLSAPRQVAVAAFAVFILYREIVRPPLHRMAMSVLRSRALKMAPVKP